MFTGTMLFRAEQGQYPWRLAIPLSVAVLGMSMAAGIWHHIPGSNAHANFIWDRAYFMSLFVAGLTFAAGLALRGVRWPRALAWLGLISYSVYLLHPPLMDLYHHFGTLHHAFWPQLGVDVLFFALLIGVCSLTYLLVERPMQELGRRVGRQLDLRYGPDRPPAPPRRAEPALAGAGRPAAD